MTQTVLYYPTISIPNTEWLRQSLFYFDKIASIAPRMVWDPDEQKDFVPLTPELEYLQHEGVYEPLDPESLTGDTVPLEKQMPEKQSWAVAHQLGEEFAAKVQYENRKAGPNSNFVPVHRGKLHGTLLSFLENKGLLAEDKGLHAYDVPKERWYKKYLRNSRKARYEGQWLLIEERTALLYMSMLAQALADINPESMVPGTDLREYEDLIYGAAQENSLPCIETRLRAVLPIPRQDVSFADILDFKSKRGQELLQYRAKIDELQKQLKETKTFTEVREAIRIFEEAQRRDLTNLIAALKDAKVATIWGSLKTLTKANSPTFWGSVAVAGGLAANVAALPIAFVVAGTALAGMVEVKSYLTDERNKRSALERASSFAYLYHGNAEGILAP